MHFLTMFRENHLNINFISMSHKRPLVIFLRNDFEWMLQ